MPIKVREYQPPSNLTLRSVILALCKFKDHYGAYPNTATPGSVAWWFQWDHEWFPNCGRPYFNGVHVSWANINQALFESLWGYDGRAKSTLARMVYLIDGPPQGPPDRGRIWDAVVTYYQTHGEAPTRDTEGDVSVYFGWYRDLTWSQVDDMLASNTEPHSANSLEEMRATLESE